MSFGCPVRSSQSQVNPGRLKSSILKSQPREVQARGYASFELKHMTLQLNHIGLNQTKLLCAAHIFREFAITICQWGPAWNILGLFLSIKDHRTDRALHGKESLVEIAVIWNPHVPILESGRLFLRAVKTQPVSSNELGPVHHSVWTRLEPLKKFDYFLSLYNEDTSWFAWYREIDILM